MNYLDAINSVLKRLRERAVDTPTENEYSTLIGILINDSLQEIEQAWDWSALRTSLTVTTSVDVFNYELNGSQNNFKVLDVVNTSSKTFLTYATAHWMNQQFLISTSISGSPTKYSFNGVSADGDTLVDLHPIPSGVYSLQFNVVQRSGELTESADKITVPSTAVVLLAYAKAVEERGEDNGQTGNSAYVAAHKSMSNAIALDANKHPEELDWYSA
jgi:hypothetical protein